MWEFEIELCIPKAQTAIGQKGSLPEKCKYETLIGSFDNATNISDVAFQFASWPVDRESLAPKDSWPLLYESVLLVAKLDAADFNHALQKVSDGLEKICDQLTFYVQNPVAALSVIVSSPEGAKTLHPNDLILRSSMNMPINRGAEMGADCRWLSVELCKDLEDRKIDAALRWYRKAISETHIEDRFIHLWICLEIMCKQAGIKVIKPYVVEKCRHIIKECPQCHAPTDKMVQGDTIKSFLEQLGINKETAGKLWDVRQMVHGQSLNQKLQGEFHGLSSSLYTAVTDAIKRSLDLTPIDRPLPPINVMFGGYFARRIE